MMEGWTDIDTKHPTKQHAHTILQNQHGHRLWLGDFSSAEDVPFLKHHHIQTVISITSGISPNYSTISPPIHHHKYTLRDAKNQNIFIYFQPITEKIERGLSLASVLVHCGAGVSRSAAFVIAYLMKMQRLTFHEALNYCRKKRSVVCPNLGFEKQLKLYERSLKIKRNDTIQFELPPVLTRAGTQFTKRQNTIEKMRSNISASCVKREPDAKTVSINSVMRNAGNREQREQNQQYLRKIAAFRFGMTLETTKIEPPRLQLPHC